MEVVHKLGFRQRQHKQDTFIELGHSLGGATLLMAQAHFLSHSHSLSLRRRRNHSFVPLTDGVSEVQVLEPGTFDKLLVIEPMIFPPPAYKSTSFAPTRDSCFSFDFDGRARGSRPREHDPQLRPRRAFWRRRRDDSTPSSHQRRRGSTSRRARSTAHGHHASWRPSFSTASDGIAPACSSSSATRPANPRSFESVRVCVRVCVFVWPLMQSSRDRKLS